MIVGILVHRPVRSLISIVAVALEVSLILLIVGYSLGMLEDSRTRTAGIGADVIVLFCASCGALGVMALKEFRFRVNFPGSTHPANRDYAPDCLPLFLADHTEMRRLPAIERSPDERGVAVRPVRALAQGEARYQTRSAQSDSARPIRKCGRWVTAREEP